MNTIIVVDDGNISISSIDVAPEVTVSAEVITVIPTQETRSSTQLVLNVPEVIVAPSVIPPELNESYGIEELYILVIDVETLELWQHNINDLSTDLDNLEQLHTNLSLVVTALQNSTDVTAANVAVLQADHATLLARVNAFYIQYNALAAIVADHTDTLANLDTSVTNFTQLVNQLDASFTSLDERITANAALNITYGLAITELQNNVNAAAYSITNLSISMSDLQIQQVANANLLDSMTLDITSINGDLIVTGNRITAIDTNITDLDNRILANAITVDSLFSQVTDIDGEFTALAAHTTEILAELPTSFNPVVLWEFIESLEGWTPEGSAELTHAVQLAKISGDGYMEVTLDTPIDGEIYPVITLRWKADVDLNLWVGEVYYKYTGGPSTFTQTGSFSHIYGDTLYRQSTIDCDWEDREITAIAIKFSTGGAFTLDSVGIGYKTGFGPLAYVREQSVAWVTESAAFASYTQSVDATFLAKQALIEINATAISNIEGDLSSAWSLKVTAGTKAITGMFLTANGVDDSSSFKILTDNFYIAHPDIADIVVFEAATEDGNHYIKMANVRIESDIKSNDYSSTPGSYSGWKINQSGLAEFNSIIIRAADGTEILSTVFGLNTSNIANQIETDLAALLLEGNPVTTTFANDLYLSIKDAIESNAATYISTLLVDEAAIFNAVIKTAHIEELTVGSSQIATGAITEFIFDELSPLVTYGATSGGGYTICTMINKEDVVIPAIATSSGTEAPYIRYDFIFDSTLTLNLGYADFTVYVELWLGDPAVGGSVRLLQKILQYDTTLSLTGSSASANMLLSYVDGPTRGLLSGTYDIHVILRKGNGASVEVHQAELTMQMFKK